MIKQAFISFFCLANIFVSEAQVAMNRDSLLLLLPQAREDSNAIDLYINIGQQYEFNEPEVAKKYYRMARDLSEKLNYPKGIIRYIHNYSYVLNTQGNFDSALLLNLQGVELSKKINDSLSLAKSLFNTGNSYRFKTEYQTAFPYYLEGMSIFEKLGFDYYVVQALDILQVISQDLKQNQKAVRYGEEALEKGRKLNNPQIYANVMLNLGVSYIKLNQFQKALDLLNETIRISRQINNNLIECNALLNVADCYLKLNQYHVLKPYYEKALALSKVLNDVESEIVALRGISIFYSSENNYVLAKQFAVMSVDKAVKYNFSLQLIESYTQLSKIYYSLHDMKQGEYYVRQAVQLSDSLLNDNIKKTIVEMEKKYETEKKETRIKNLEAEKKLQRLSIRQKSTLNYILIGSAVTLLIISLLSYRNYDQKQKLQQQRITELETQHQLTATEAVLKGEEQERTRLAKDLHDGLGGMLSGIKYSFNTMKGNLIMTPENNQAFERSMDMLDSSIKEMRRVAHNMMPEALVKFGLDTALKDFCNDINQSGAIRATYQSFGLENAVIEQTTAVTIYRIVQELINNTMKHAAAKTAIIQVSKTNSTISITVEDDGKGFNPVILQGIKARPDDQVGRGIGWSNIQSRVEYLKGKLDVQSEPGKGTSVHIELNT